MVHRESVAPRDLRMCDVIAGKSEIFSGSFLALTIEYIPSCISDISGSVLAVSKGVVRTWWPENTYL